MVLSEELRQLQEKALCPIPWCRLPDIKLLHLLTLVLYLDPKSM